MNQNQTHVDHLAPHAAPQLLPPPARLGTVHLDVTNRQNSRLFWSHYVGLTVLSETDDTVRLGVGDTELIVLHAGASAPVAPRHTGLYHVAIHLPTQKELARLAARLFAVQWPHSPTDHTETMATYFSDPDGNGIEITFETPERGHLVRDNSRYSAMLADGTLRGATEALDIDLLMSALDESDDLVSPMPVGTRIGHVHLHVNDLAAARSFYADVIGFGDMRAFERIGMSDLSLETSFVPHALALNIWNGRDATARPEGTAGLRQWELVLPRSAKQELLGRLDDAGVAYAQDGAVIRTQDPAGNSLHIALED